MHTGFPGSDGSPGGPGAIGQVGPKGFQGPAGPAGGGFPGSYFLSTPVYIKKQKSSNILYTFTTNCTNSFF